MKKTKYYIVTVQYPTGTGYIQVTEDTHGDDNIKFRLHSSRAHVTYTQNFATAKRWARIAADTLKRPTSVEDLDEAIRAGRKSHKKNPAPGPAERSEKFHRLRAKLLTQLQIAKRKGSFVLEQSVGRKLLKLDRMFYAARTIKRKPTHKKNPSWTPKRDKEESYQNRRVFLRAKAAKKKGRKPTFLNLKTQGTRDAISDYRLGRRDPDRAMNRYEDHTYATAYRATMKKMISKRGA